MFSLVFRCEQHGMSPVFFQDVKLQENRGKNLTKQIFLKYSFLETGNLGLGTKNVEYRVEIPFSETTFSLQHK